MIKRNDILALQRAIAAMPERVSRGDVARAIADVIQAGNPKFQRAAFIKEEKPQPIHVAAPLNPFDPETEERLARIMDED